jgi:hypothetical protein
MQFKLTQLKGENIVIKGNTINNGSVGVHILQVQLLFLIEHLNM